MSEYLSKQTRNSAYIYKKVNIYALYRTIAVYITPTSWGTKEK